MRLLLTGLLDGLTGSSLIKSGLASLRRLSPDMNSLVATGVLAVYLSSAVAILKPSLGLTATFHEPVRLRLSFSKTGATREIPLCRVVSDPFARLHMCTLLVCTFCCCTKTGIVATNTRARNPSFALVGTIL